MTSSREDASGNTQQEINATDKSTIHHVYQSAINSSSDSIHIGPTYTHSKQDRLNDYLARAVAIYKGSLFQAVAQFPHPSAPYKLMSSFCIEDASIFCGRINATKDIYKKVFQSRLLILHAKSGAGKTSLLNAGLFPYIIRQNCLPLYIHTYDKDPIWIIKQTLIPAALGLWPDGLRNLSLHDFLKHVCTFLKRDNKVEELIIVLDQFEDFFLYRMQPSERLSFIKALGDCYSDQTMPIRIIIALRKDYYSDLIEFEEILPHLHIFHNHYRPSPMTQQEMKEAISQPLKKLNSDVTYDPALLDILISELSRNEIELPLLQIVCTRLYETLGKNKKRITIKMYEDLGKTEGVLQSYLNEVLEDLPEQEQILIKNILKEFVRSDLTKQTLSYYTLIERIGAQKNKLDHVLTQLINARLLYRDDIEGETRYELVHEYLATEIVKWIDVEDREFKRAEELLKSEIANWRSYNHLIPLERLELLYQYRERFKGLDAIGWECLIRSAIDAEISQGDEAVETDVTNWVKVVSNIDATLLSKAIVEPLLEELQDHNKWVRSNAAQGLAKVGKYGGTQAVDSLLSALQDSNYYVRAYAAEALGEIGDIRALNPLIFALQDKDEYVRIHAAGALGEIGDICAVDPLLSALQDTGNYQAAEALGKLKDPRAFYQLILMLNDNNSVLRRWAAWGLGKFGDVRAVEPLILALKNETDYTRIGPLRALGELGDMRALDPLVIALQADSYVVRQDAAEALGMLGDMRAIEPLVAALQDNDNYVQKKAEWAIENIKRLKRF